MTRGRLWPSILSEVFGEHVQRVGVEDERLFRLADEFEDKFFGLGMLAEAGTDGEDGGSFEERFQPLGIEVGAGDFAVLAFEHGDGH